MNRRVIVVVRWIAVIPAIVVGYAGAVLVAKIIGWIHIHMIADDSGNILWILPVSTVEKYGGELLLVICGPYGAVRLAQAVAPSAKLATAAITALLCAMVAGCALTFVVMGWFTIEWSLPPAFSVVCVILFVASSAAAVWETYKEHESRLRRRNTSVAQQRLL